MDTVNTPKRLPLGGLDANRRHTPTPSGSGKSSDENAVLGKRMAKEENQSESTGNTPNKKRKISDIRVPIVGEDKACDEVPIIEVNDYDFEEAEKGMEAGKIGDEVVVSIHPCQLSGRAVIFSINPKLTIAFPELNNKFIADVLVRKQPTNHDPPKFSRDQHHRIRPQ